MRLPTPYRNEAEVVQQALQSLDGALNWEAAAQVARPWVQAVRDTPAPFWALESLLKEYPIASAEGLALMRLAEALLRVPDVDTAVAFTADQLRHTHTDGHENSALARLSSTALMLSRQFLPEADQPLAQAGLMTRLGARAVVAATLRAVQLLGRQFVLGEDITSAQAHALSARQAAGPARADQLSFSFDMLGEGARTEADARRYLAAYAHAISHISDPRDGISIKLSALHPRYEALQHERVMQELVPRVWALCERAAKAGINLTIDAEEVDRLELSLDVMDALAARVAAQQPQWTGLGMALQAYQTRGLALVEHVAQMARRHGIRMTCRLVKGAYWDAEIKRAQDMGLPHYPVFTHKHHTDIHYLACAQALLAANDVIHPQFATHNAGTIAAIVQMARQAGASFELQRLHGMGEGIYREVLKDPSVRCRVYAPVGQHRDLLAYLVRRLLENGANASFVHQLADPTLGLDNLLASPLHAANEGSLPMPAQLFGPDRPNSEGMDLSLSSQQDLLQQAWQTCVLPQVPENQAADVAQCAAQGLSALPAWRALPVTERAQALREAARHLQARMPEFAALLVKEARKTWPDAVSEVRESIDFLRYYAQEAERVMAPVTLPAPHPGLTGEHNEWRLAPRGLWVCISPWNFPLAIFTGQVAAALVTGNAVLAKPAEQTPGVAAAMVALLHECGVPTAVLQMLHGPGQTIGAALVAHPAVAGVAFTGSTEVAKAIQRALAAKDGPIVPLIAETGGINAMVVDSTALPEQVADAVIHSAFKSAGQRCSALRLLCLHESVADRIIEMIQGAASTLRLGDPARFDTDVGPLIDEAAYQNVVQHLRRLQETALPLLALQPEMSTGMEATEQLLGPHAFEMAHLSDVAQEVFGPVLHVVRWRGDPQAVIDQINELGYGLTLGLQTRIDSRAQALAQRAQVGNVYVNRHMIGAVVGLQPFGGEGLSGTGPKAGGPLYLQRFCTERVVTVNTTAAGGNVSLLAG
ncbi:MAG TPA: L-glutamate gamma-semialdehyde dehydrogenase [Aquabacterium sp.]|nr:L-glutamate gamma-semialdehyde dehydrogenase [Aquabacterium sp.]